MLDYWNSLDTTTKVKLKGKYFPDTRFTNLSVEQIKHICSQEIKDKILFYLEILPVQTKLEVLNDIKNEFV